MKLVKFENDYIALEIKDGILYGNYREDLVITLPIAKEIVTDRIKFQQQENYNSIPIVGNLNIKYVNKAARKYLSVEGTEGLTAAAFIVKTMGVKILLNIFLLIEQPKIPICMFEDEKKAVDWIKQFVVK